MKTEKRKDLHLKTAMKKESQFRKTSLFEEIELIHNPLLDCELTEIKTQTTFLGKKFSFPLCIRPITGGTKKSFELNKNIALACEKKGIGFALGSMRAGLENKSKIEFFKLRKYCPSIFLEANIGALELAKHSAKKIDDFAEEIQADAVSVHLNSAQELMQNSKTKGFSEVFNSIKNFAEQSNFPVIVKEVGNGISFETAKKLDSTKINAIDVAGRGGTSFVKIDSILHGKKRLGEVFGEFGIPTAASVLFTKKASKKKIIASGGIRNGLDVCKSLVLGADLAGIAVPAIRNAGNEKSVENLLDSFKEELVISMFLIGARNTEELKHKKFVLQDNLREWINA
ncbi:MAG: type 2 isopentenyl-diphosphate Delta-isomerase [Candidatus Diapherotrites archaeon CG10_big_fil_rev_8_21_14_0_10_31_34]|nr:MAG: type 2 isopentenyl-diphosphate Delta-isomerase [Candidatus Diapherotrites archaeon CG10_big_fil_rev_8_21_14_0_10_31_34]PJA16970.1 MAG: type 2 isopentenyl-diphosphate Delta-isomerase [Candidatus Diapherotrites archaeon CG_4_10_14_0_2_um_filter_31_5]